MNRHAVSAGVGDDDSIFRVNGDARAVVEEILTEAEHAFALVRPNVDVHLAADDDVVVAENGDADGFADLLIHLCEEEHREFMLKLQEMLKRG